MGVSLRRCAWQLRRAGRLLQPALLLPWGIVTALVLTYSAWRLGSHAYLGVQPWVGNSITALAVVAVAGAALGAVITYLHHHHLATIDQIDTMRSGSATAPPFAPARRTTDPSWASIRSAWRLAGVAGALGLLAAELLLIQDCAHGHAQALRQSAAHHAAAAALAAASPTLAADSHMHVQRAAIDSPQSTSSSAAGPAFRPPETWLCTYPQTGDEPLLLTVDFHPRRLLEPGAPQPDLFLLHSPNMQLGLRTLATKNQAWARRLYHNVLLPLMLPILRPVCAWLGDRRWTARGMAATASSPPHALVSDAAKANVLWTEESSVYNMMEHEAAFMGSINFLATTAPKASPGVVFASWGFSLLVDRLRVPAPPLEGRMTASGPRASPSAGLVVWVAKNCNANSGRLELLQRVAQVVPVHSLGTCWRNATAAAALLDGARVDRRAIPNAQDDEEADMERQWTWMGRNYKFWYAAENYLCDSYVTEKFWLALAFGSVPVLYGSSTHRQYAPAKDAFVDAHAFASPEELGRHLLALDRDDAAYQRLHAWRQRPLAELNPAFVELLRRHQRVAQSPRLSTSAAAQALGVPLAQAGVLREHNRSWQPFLCDIASQVRNASRHGQAPLPTQSPLPSCVASAGL